MPCTAFTKRKHVLPDGQALRKSCNQIATKPCISIEEKTDVALIEIARYLAHEILDEWLSLKYVKRYIRNSCYQEEKSRLRQNCIVMIDQIFTISATLVYFDNAMKSKFLEVSNKK